MACVVVAERRQTVCERASPRRDRQDGGRRQSRGASEGPLVADVSSSLARAALPPPPPTDPPRALDHPHDRRPALVHPTGVGRPRPTTPPGRPTPRPPLRT